MDYCERKIKAALLMDMTLQNQTDYSVPALMLLVEQEHGLGATFVNRRLALMHDVGKIHYDRERKVVTWL